MKNAGGTVAKDKAGEQVVSPEERILVYLKEEAQKPVRSDKLVEAVLKKKKERNEIMHALDRLVSEKKVILLKGGYAGLPDKLHFREGIFLSHPDGYGFVATEGMREDLYVPPGSTGGAMHQDKVLSVSIGTDHRGRTEGQIVDIISRARTSVVGILHKLEGGYFLSPRDPRIPHEFLVVGGETGKMKEGDLTVIDILRYPEPGHIPEGKIARSLGDPADPSIDTDLVIATHRLPVSFPDPVEEEAHEMARKVEIVASDRRTDLRHLEIMTIDGDRARDFDDALSVEESPDGTFQVGIHIADVSAYVLPGSALDKEAFRRGTSVYFPDRVIPMFPEVLSNGVLSLNPEEDRLARTVMVRMSASGQVLDSAIFRSVIRSRLRATYSRVHPILEGERTDSPEAKFSSHFRALWDLAKKLREERFRNGSLDFDLPEPEIVLDLRGEPVDIIRSPRYLSHQLVEEFMLLANRIVATELTRRYSLAMYRVHETPSPEKTEALGIFLGALGIALHKRKDGKMKASDLSAVLESTRGTPLEKMVHFSVLRSLKQARYDVHPLGHFGLAMDDYTHFTSPIRRYPDMIVHRLLDLPDGCSPEEGSFYPLEQVALQASERERASVDAERMAVDLKKIRFMGQHIGKKFFGTVSGVTGFGFFVELSDVLVEGLVPLSALNDDYYVYDEKHHLLRGETSRKIYRIGDRVEILVVRVDTERLRIEFALDQGNGSESLEKPQRKRRGKNSRRRRSGKSRKKG
ncbi:MAG: ribonuclease R [Nitrospirae bacterium]|nr:ribonuclease R [Nitrospirota bacterium]